jgi:hypothetical protein
MYFTLFVAAALHALGLVVFGRFVAYDPTPKRVAKVAVFLGLTALVTATLGETWGLVWVVGMMSLGTILHIWWCRKHGINALTAEPRAKYWELRGWKLV